MAIPRGSTPTHIFEIPFDTEIVKKVRITYAQNDEEILSKKTEDCTIVGNEVITELTQAETLLFNHSYPVQIQIKVLDVNDKIHTSDVIVKSVKKCLNEEVLE